MDWIFEGCKTYNVKDMYEQSKDDNKPLLSNYGGAGSFWAGYKSNHEHFDRLFMRKYTSLIPLDQDYASGVDEVTDEFRAECYAWLLANDKRYTELFRVNNIPDNDAYSLTNNVDYTETTSRDVIFDKGEQENTLDGETNYGQQVVDDDKEFNFNTTNSEGSTTTQSTSAYNDSGYTPTDKSVQEINGYTDTQDNSMTYGAHKDERDDTMTEGARHDVTDEDITIHKVGNMGVQTVDDMLKKHWENWSMFDFYGLIFEDIAKNLLRGC